MQPVLLPSSPSPPAPLLPCSGTLQNLFRFVLEGSVGRQAGTVVLQTRVIKLQAGIFAPLPGTLAPLPGAIGRQAGTLALLPGAIERQAGTIGRQAGIVVPQAGTIVRSGPFQQRHGSALQWTYCDFRDGHSR